MEDILIRGAWIVDGTGREKYRGDVLVKNGRIAQTGNVLHSGDERVIDAEGLVAAPGFIDAHAHSDTSFLLDSSSASKLYQGITTEICGNCGDSPFPAPPGCEHFGQDEWCASSFDAFVRAFEEGPFAMGTNQAMLTGHGTLRSAVMGYDGRKAGPAELEEMKRLLRRDLEAGSFGLSLGLEYAPGCFADEEELCALGEVVREYGRVVTCHMRSEGLKIDEAIEELLNVGRASGVHVHISHLKIDNYRVHGRAEEVWERIERAKREGVLVTADMYPYAASSTTLSIRCPRWALEGAEDALVRYLQGPRREEIVEGIRTHYFNRERASTCLFSSDGGYWPEIVGKTLVEVAENFLHTSDYAEAAAEVLLRTRGKAWGIFSVMSEADMRCFLSRDIGIGSDGYALPGDPALLSYAPHPRSFGAIARFLELSREEKIAPLEEAVRRITSKAADMAGLSDRGRLLPGMAADITVFDPGRIRSRATYLDPVRLAEGVEYVLIGGETALEKGKQTSVRAGRFLRRRA